MADLKLGSTVGGAPIWSGANLPLRASGDTLEYKDFEIYHEGHKPTPAEVGAVNKAGDTMTGELKANGDISISNANPKLSFVETDASNKRWEIECIGGNFYVDEAGVSSRLTILAGGETRIAGVVKQQVAQGTTVDSLTRKDYVDNNDNLRVKKAGDEMTGSLVINTTNGQLKLKETDTTRLWTFDANGNKLVIFNNSAAGLSIDANNNTTVNDLTANRLLANRPTTLTDFNTPWQSGFIESNAATNSPTTASGWWYGITTGQFSNTSAIKAGMQLVGTGTTGDSFYARVRDSDGAGTWARLYSDKYKPKWTDVEGDTYFEKNSSGYLTAKNWVQASGDTTGFLPFSTGNSHLGTSTFKFKSSHIISMNTETITFSTDMNIRRSGTDLIFSV